MRGPGRGRRAPAGARPAWTAPRLSAPPRVPIYLADALLELLLSSGWTLDEGEWRDSGAFDT